jgi:hypothetical protein
MNMTTVLCGGATFVIGVQNFHPAIFGLPLKNSKAVDGELAVKVMGGRIGAPVVGRPVRSFWICQRIEGRDGVAR